MTSAIHIELTDLVIDVSLALSKFAGNGKAGAISSFLGTTRGTIDSPTPKQVLKLEYECYRPMALKKMNEICMDAINVYQLLQVSIIHRLGIVGVGEISVVVICASVHRKESIRSIEYIMDQLKLVVPIWKKEVYADGSIWKGN